MPDLDLLQKAIKQEKRRKRRSRIMAFVLTVVVLTPVGMTLGTLAGYTGDHRLMLAPIVISVLLVAGMVLISAVQWVAGAIMSAFVAPGGAARGGVQHSKAQALAASGLLDEATAEFDALREAGIESLASLRAETELL